jgi:hypothetical protein
MASSLSIQNRSCNHNQLAETGTTCLCAIPTRDKRAIHVYSMRHIIAKVTPRKGYSLGVFVGT